MRVLVADDDLGSRLVAQAAVQALWHECVVASDGDQAWQLYLQWQPEVLVTDRMMPGMDGTQLCRAIRDDENGSCTYGGEEFLLVLPEQDSEGRRRDRQLGAAASRAITTLSRWATAARGR